MALDARTGRPKWDVEMGKVEDNLSGTAPPLAVGDKVFLGIAGGDFPSRAFVDAYDARTGKRLWRFYTVPAAGEKGAETWLGRSNETGGGGHLDERLLRPRDEDRLLGHGQSLSRLRWRLPPRRQPV